MIWATLVCVTLTTFAVAAPSRRADNLRVEVTPSRSSINSLDDLELTAFIRNTGVEAVKIIKYGTVLDSDLPTRSFIVTKDGQPIHFTGIKISVSLNASNDSTAYVTIYPGQTLTVSHSLGSLYDFNSAGVGKYTFEPITTFLFAGQSDQEEYHKLSFREQTTSSGVDVQINGGLDTPRNSHVQTRATNGCMDPSMNKFIADSFAESQTLASAAAAYIQTRGADSLYTSYFGATPANDVRGIFSAVANENSPMRTFHCVDTYNGCVGDVLAYTHDTNDIFFCPKFFQEAPLNRLCQDTSVQARNVRGGSTLHELTHALASTVDVTYGCPNDQALGDQGVHNADSFNCFATQVYANRCLGA